MMTLVVYDISDNKSRNDLISRLRHFGLRRLQKSVFMGELDQNSRLDLAEDFETYLSSPKDSVAMIPICDSCRESILTEGNIEIPNTDLTYRFI